MLITLLLSREEKWEPLETMMVSAIVFGHHGNLPSAKELRDIGIGMFPKVLKRQIATLQIDGLKQHCALDTSKLDLEGRPWTKALKYLDDFVLPEFEGLSIEDALIFRLKTQLLFSLLLEADKALLAIKEPRKYLHRKPRYWMSQWVDKKIGSPENTLVNKIRQSLRINLKNQIEEIERPGIFSLTAPTGSGKTMLSATWLLKSRENMGKRGLCPRAIIVLPFLSVIDQTTREYESLLAAGGQKVDGSWLLTSHSLSDRKYKQGLEENAEHFFVDTWRTELIITTYDQFLMTLMDSKTRYQMRFHNLCDSLIVMDEVQSLPCRLWKPLEEILKCIVKIGNSSVLLMSATLPPIISNAKPLVKNYSTYFKMFNRYKLQFRSQEKLKVSDFCNEVFRRRSEWLRNGKRVLITLNTRNSARIVRDTLANDWPHKYSNVPLYFLSADVTPRDRIDAIKTIKEDTPCIVVSTQCIEAGVDIDMDIVIRDFAPFDSLIQIAGRCNRNGQFTHPATVEIVDLSNELGKRYSDMVYDDVHLQVTRQLMVEITEIEEKDILALADRYFEMLTAKKDTGMEHLKKFARWEEDRTVRELLRGKDREKYTFLVIKQDPELKDAMTQATKIDNCWKRREAWRAIAGRIAKISVSVYATCKFNPQDIAVEYLGQWILHDRFYSTDRGLVLDDDSTKRVLIL
jgi:CRISPR-associated endonuclease/helicase Cas3